MSFAGLQNSSAFQALSQADKDLYSRIRYNEQEGNNNITYTGSGTSTPPVTPPTTSNP